MRHISAALPLPPRRSRSAPAWRIRRRMDELRFRRPRGQPAHQSLRDGRGADGRQAFDVRGDETKTSWFQRRLRQHHPQFAHRRWLVVIGILVIMSGISWMVMVQKAKISFPPPPRVTRNFSGLEDVAVDLSFLDQADTRKVLSLGGRIDNREAGWFGIRPFIAFTKSARRKFGAASTSKVRVKRAACSQPGRFRQFAPCSTARS